MRVEGFLIAMQSVSSAAAGAVIVFGETREGLALLAISGVASVISSMFYRAHDTEDAARDLVVTIFFPFMAGAFFAQPLGQMLSAAAMKHAQMTLSPLATNGIAGCLTGLGLTPFARAVVSGKLANLKGAAEAALKVLKGGQ